MSQLGKLLLCAVVLLLGLSAAGTMWWRAEVAQEQAEHARLKAEQATLMAQLGVSDELIPPAPGVDTSDDPARELPSDPEAAGLVRDNDRLRAEADELRQQLAELQAEVARLAAERR